MPQRTPKTRRPDRTASHAAARALAFVLTLLPLPPAMARAATLTQTSAGMSAAPLVMLDAGARGPVVLSAGPGPRLPALQVALPTLPPLPTPQAVGRVGAEGLGQGGARLAALGRRQLDGG